MENSTFVSDTEWENWINDGIAELHDLIIKADETAFLTKTGSTAFTGAESYNLPSDFYKLVAIFRLDGGQRRRLARLTLHDLTQDDFAPSVGGPPHKYYIMGSQVHFYPTPASGNYDLWYVPSATRVTGATTIDYPIINGWETYLEAFAVLRAKQKEESPDVGNWTRELDRLTGRILQMAAKKDTFEGPKSRDVYDSIAPRRYRRR